MVDWGGAGTLFPTVGSPNFLLQRSDTSPACVFVQKSRRVACETEEDVSARNNNSGTLSCSAQRRAR